MAPLLNLLQQLFVVKSLERRLLLFNSQQLLKLLHSESALFTLFLQFAQQLFLDLLPLILLPQNLTFKFLKLLFASLPIFFNFLHEQFNLTLLNFDLSFEL